MIFKEEHREEDSRGYQTNFKLYLDSLLYALLVGISSMGVIHIKEMSKNIGILTTSTAVIASKVLMLSDNYEKLDDRVRELEKE